MVNASRPGLRHQVERRFGNAPEALEAALRHHLSQTLLAGLRAKSRTDLLETRCGCAYECRRRVEDASDAIEIVLESVIGEGLDDQPCAIGFEAGAYMGSRACRVAYVVKAVEHRNVVIGFGEILSSGDFDADPVAEPWPHNIAAGCLGR